MKKILLLPLLLISILNHTIAQKNDHLFVQKGDFSTSVYTGIPYLGLAEVNYGLSDRINAGIIVGHTPNVAGYGVRIRAVIFQKQDHLRVYFRMPILYYPKTERYGDEPWMLTWPVINAEWKPGSKGTWTAGMGVVEAHRVLAMWGGSNDEASPTVWNNPCPDWDSEMTSDLNAGWWNTIQVGYSHPIAKNMAFTSEVAAVMKGIKLAGSDYVGGPPVILVLGLTRNF